MDLMKQNNKQDVCFLIADVIIPCSYMRTLSLNSSALNNETTSIPRYQSERLNSVKQHPKLCSNFPPFGLEIKKKKTVKQNNNKIIMYFIM